MFWFLAALAVVVLGGKKTDGRSTTKLAGVDVVPGLPECIPHGQLQQHGLDAFKYPQFIGMYRICVVPAEGAGEFVGLVLTPGGIIYESDPVSGTVAAGKRAHAYREELVQ